MGAVQRELQKLADVDLLVRTSVGNQVFYQVNKRNPVFHEMRALVNKTVGIFGILRSAVEQLADKVTIAFGYGSVASHQERAESDIDLIIVGNVNLDDVLAHISGAQTTLRSSAEPHGISCP